MYDPALQSAFAVIEKFYADMETHLEPLRAASSCSPKCNVCCYQLLRVSTFEAAHMLDLMPVTNAEIEPYEDKQRSTVTGNMVDLPKWLQLKQPCIFLVNGVCAVYPNRPWICRSHFVTSDPEYCGELTTRNVVQPIFQLTPQYFETMETAAKLLPLPYGAIPLYTALRWANLYKDGGISGLYETVRKENSK